MSLLPAPAIRLSISNSTLSIISAHTVLSFSISSHASEQKYLSSSAGDSPVPESKNLKGESVRLIDAGIVPKGKVMEEGKEKELEGEQEWEQAVASLTDNKVLRVTSVETGETLYERNTAKKGSFLSISSSTSNSASIILSDKIGDVYSYPYIDESPSSSTSSSTPGVKATRPPIAIEAATDPTLNPDADLLAGHVSNVTCHLVIPRTANGSEVEGKEKQDYDGPWLVSADRDEHVRISRYPESYVIEKYLFGHESFVSALHSPSAHPHLLLTAGGDPDILIFNHITGHLIHRVPILEEYRKNRVVRSGLRYFKGHKGKGKGKGKGKADEVEDAGAGAGEEGEMSGIQETGKEAGTTAEPTEDVGKAINEGKIENLTEEEWAYSPDGWMLPAGEGLCVGKIESFGDWAVYFTEGSKAIHSFRIPTTSEERGQNCQSIITHGLPSPVLDFVLVPRETTASAATSSQTILISTDPAWSQRVDGGKALHGVDANASGRQKDKGPRAAGEENLGEQEIEKLGMNGFKMVEISGVDGSFTDISEKNRSLLDLLHEKLTRLPPTDALSIAAYANLSLLPKWPGLEEDDPPAPGGAIDIPTSSDLSNMERMNRKRTLGRLKAAGVEVNMPVKTQEQKLKRHESNMARKKRKMEAKRASKLGGISKAIGQDETAALEKEETAGVEEQGPADEEMEDLEADMNE